MTSPNEQFSKIARQGQEALNNAVRVWADSVQRLAGGRGGGQVTDMTAVVDSAFDFAERVLQTQREFTKSVLRAVSGATGRVTDATLQGVDRTARAGAGAASQAASGAAHAAGSAARAAAGSAQRTAGATQSAAEGLRQGTGHSSADGSSAGPRGSRG